MKAAVIVLTAVLLFSFVTLSGCIESQSPTDGGIFGTEKTTTTVEPDGSTITTTVGPGGVTTLTTVDPEGVVTTTHVEPGGVGTISSRIETSCTFLPEGSEGRDYCIYDAVVMRGEPASRCNEIVDEDLKADCIANSSAGQTGG